LIGENSSESTSLDRTAVASPDARTAARFRTLYVDDDPICRESLARWLRHAHFDVSPAAHPAAAETLLATETFDVLLSDICMPGNRDLEWIERVVRRTNLPVVLITASPELKTAVRAVNLPIAGYLLKPCNLTELGGLLGALGAQQLRRRELRAVAAEITELANNAATPETSHPFSRQLAMLARSFADEAIPHEYKREPAASGDTRLRLAISETVDVLQRTKHHFRSKELGALRQRLEQLLASLAAPAANATRAAKRDAFELS
jgi:CheY-like chemotaxis protein